MTLDRPLRCGFIMALAGLATAFVGMVYMNITYIILSFYFAVCWLVWFACALLPGKRKAMHLLILWLLIDVAIFIQCLALEQSFGHGPLSGAEYIWAISYAPVIFPAGFIYARVFYDAIHHAQDLVLFLGPTLGRVLGDWLGFSFLAAAQSLLIVSGALTARNIYRTIILRTNGTAQKRAAT